MQLGPIWNNQQVTKHNSFSKWWICYEDYLVFPSSIILNLKMASSLSSGIRWSKRLFNLKTCLFPSRDDHGTCVCKKLLVRCDWVCIVNWSSPHIICCTSLNLGLTRINMCSREHLFPLVKTSSFKMDARDGWLVIASVMCIWV